MNDVPDTELFSAYLDGELTADEHARVEQLLAASPVARQLLEELRAVGSSLQLLPQQKLDEDLSARVLEIAERRMLLPAQTDEPVEEQSDKASGKVADARPSAGRAGRTLAPQSDSAGDSIGWLGVPWREISWRGMFSRRALIWSGVVIATGVIISLTSSPPKNHIDDIARGDKPGRATVAASPAASGVSLAGEVPVASGTPSDHESWQAPADPARRLAAKPGEVNSKGQGAKLDGKLEEKLDEKLVKDKLGKDEAINDKNRALKPGGDRALKELELKRSEGIAHSGEFSGELKEKSALSDRSELERRSSGGRAANQKDGARENMTPENKIANIADNNIAENASQSNAAPTNAAQNNNATPNSNAPAVADSSKAAKMDVRDKKATDVLQADAPLAGRVDNKQGALADLKPADTKSVRPAAESLLESQSKAAAQSLVVMSSAAASPPVPSPTVPTRSAPSSAGLAPAASAAASPPGAAPKPSAAPAAIGGAPVAKLGAGGLMIPESGKSASPEAAASLPTPPLPTPPPPAAPLPTPSPPAVAMQIEQPSPAPPAPAPAAPPPAGPATAGPSRFMKLPEQPDAPKSSAVAGPHPAAAAGSLSNKRGPESSLWQDSQVASKGAADGRQRDQVMNGTRQSPSQSSGAGGFGAFGGGADNRAQITGQNGVTLVRLNVTSPAAEKKVFEQLLEKNGLANAQNLGAVVQNSSSAGLNSTGQVELRGQYYYLTPAAGEEARRSDAAKARSWESDKGDAAPTQQQATVQQQVRVRQAPVQQQVPTKPSDQPSTESLAKRSAITGYALPDSLPGVDKLRYQCEVSPEQLANILKQIKERSESFSNPEVESPAPALQDAGSPSQNAYYGGNVPGGGGMGGGMDSGGRGLQYRPAPQQEAVQQPPVAEKLPAARQEQSKADDGAAHFARQEAGPPAAARPAAAQPAAGQVPLGQSQMVVPRLTASPAPATQQVVFLLQVVGRVQPLPAAAVQPAAVQAPAAPAPVKQ